MTDVFNIGDVLRAVASAMHYPVIILLILFLLAALALLGWLLAEYFTERRHMSVALPSLLETMQHTDDLNACIEDSGLLRRQKDALKELAAHPDFSAELREALAVRLLDAEQERYDRIVRLSELVSRLAPMFGLLGTLIPLGPGIIALGQGDTFTLSSSLLTAFDTTVAGLLAASVTTVVSSLRKSWYKEYMSVLEVLSQCVLDRAKEAAL
jgi:biopolymer transport protein ExbB/TolQ